MSYLNYVVIVGLASFSAAVVCCAAIWLMAPYLLERARRGETVPGPELPQTAKDNAPSGLIFDFTVEQIPALAALLEKEGPDDTAIILAHLPYESALALLAALTPEKRVKVLLSLASPRKVDPQLVRGIKAELENRLCGMVGGAAKAAAFMKPLPYSERKDLLNKISSQDPARGGELRSFFIFAEDLASLSETDLGALADSIPPEKMATFLPGLPEGVKTRVKERLSAKAVRALEKAEEAASPGPQEKAAALENFIVIAEKLADKGLISKPAPAKVNVKKTGVPVPAAKDEW